MVRAAVEQYPRAQVVGDVLLGGAGAALVHQPLGEIGQRPAEVGHDEEQSGSPVERSGEHESRRDQRRREHGVEARRQRPVPEGIRRLLEGRMQLDGQPPRTGQLPHVVIREVVQAVLAVVGERADPRDERMAAELVDLPC